MEALPLELQEHIFSFLLPHVDYSTIGAVPTSSRAERISIYNLRLTSRAIKTGASQVFIKVIEDVPTKVTEGSLQVLNKLTSLPRVSEKVTRLAFNTSKLFIGKSHEEQTLDHLKLKRDARDEWIEISFQGGLMRILRRLSRLEHLIVVHRLVSGVDIEKFGWRRQMAIERVARSAEDPLFRFRQSLEEYGVNLRLKSFLLLTGSEAFIIDGAGAWSPEAGDPLETPLLEHLTFGSICHDLSGFRVQASSITSLHIILGPQDFDLDLNMVQYRPPLQHITLSGLDSRVADQSLWTNLTSVAFKPMPTLKSLTLRDMTVVIDIGHDVPTQMNVLPRFKDVIIDNVMICYTDEITNDGPSDPHGLYDESEGWKGFCRLFDFADRISMKVGIEAVQLRRPTKR